jgi:hypothetical protein
VNPSKHTGSFFLQNPGPFVSQSGQTVLIFSPDNGINTPVSPVPGMEDLAPLKVKYICHICRSSRTIVCLQDCTEGGQCKVDYCRYDSKHHMAWSRGCDLNHLCLARYIDQVFAIWFLQCQYKLTVSPNVLVDGTSTLVFPQLKYHFFSFDRQLNTVF